MVDLIACSTGGNVPNLFLAARPKYLKSPHETLSIFCYCLDQFNSEWQRITKKFNELLHAY